LMAGYSGTPLYKKLGIKENSHVLLLNAPRGFAIESLPPGVEIVRRPRPGLNVIVAFVRSSQRLALQFDELAASLAEGGGLWIAWPKKASAVVTDLEFANVQRTGLDAGLVDNKVCAIDEVWSGLRFVRRRKV
jgi:hypothetical protein